WGGAEGWSGGEWGGGWAGGGCGGRGGGGGGGGGVGGGGGWGGGGGRGGGGRGGRAGAGCVVPSAPPFTDYHGCLDHDRAHRFGNCPAPLLGLATAHGSHPPQPAARDRPAARRG